MERDGSEGLYIFAGEEALSFFHSIINILYF
jgi:hypothetical protein